MIGKRCLAWAAGLVLAGFGLWGCRPQPAGLPGATAAPTVAIVQGETLERPAATPNPTPTPPAATATEVVSRPISAESPTPPPPLSPTPAPPAATFAPPDPAWPTPLLPIPTPAPPLARSADIINIILLGNDNAYIRGGRTDTLIIASINTRAKTASLLSLPRDLYVYIPGWTLERINLAAPHGWGVNYPAGGGQLIKDTILYNTGIPIDYYVRVGFDGFKRIVDTLKGVDVPVICPLTDWRLKAPDLDQTLEENWEQFTLERGVQHMDGDLALWYARSRKTTSDLERGRRQQQVIAAILERGVTRDWISHVSELWGVFEDEVETDLDLTMLVKLAALAPAVRANGVRHLWLGNGALQNLTLSGKWLQRLDWEKAQPVFKQLLAPPTLGRGARGALTVEVVTNNDEAYQLSAENLIWQGFYPVHTQAPDLHTETGLFPQTSLTYHGPNFKGAYEWLLSWVFSNTPVTLDPQPDAAYDYQVQLGVDFNSCRSPLTAPEQAP